MKLRFDRFLPVLIFLLPLAVTVELQRSFLRQLEQGNAQSDANVSSEERNTIASARLEAFKLLPAFGFDNLYANWAFLGFLQYFGDTELRRETGYQLSPDYFDIVIDRDPRFVDAYVYLSNSVSLFLGQPETAIELMEKGLASLTPQTPPRSFFVWRLKAIDELLFLGDGERAKESYRMAAEWARQSTDEEAPMIAEISSQTANFLEENPVSRAAQISAWAQVLVSAKDEQAQQIAVENIEALGGTIVVNEGGQVSVNFSLDEE